MNIEKYLHNKFKRIFWLSKYVHVEITKNENNIYYGLCFDCGYDTHGQYLGYTTFCAGYEKNGCWGPQMWNRYKTYVNFSAYNLFKGSKDKKFSYVIPKDDGPMLICDWEGLGKRYKARILC